MTADGGFFFSNYLIQIPLFILWIVALVIALLRWRRRPRVSLLVTVALTVFLLRALLAPLARYLLFSQEGMEMVRLGLLNALLGIGSSLIGAVAWVLLLAAAFMVARSAASST